MTLSPPWRCGQEDGSSELDQPRPTAECCTRSTYQVHTGCTQLQIKPVPTAFSVQSIIGATDRRRDGGTMAVAAGMVEEVLMLEGVVAWEQAMNTVENAPS